MRRFTDPLLFGVLFLLSAATWWILDLNGAIPADSDGGLAPMTVAVAIVIATPALLFVTIVAFFRALMGVSPRTFWAWLTGSTALAALLIWVANLITTTQSIEVGFSTGVWLMAIASIASLIALVLALTGAIPNATSDSKTKAEPKSSRQEVAARRPGDPHLPYGSEGQAVSPPPSAGETKLRKRGPSPQADTAVNGSDTSLASGVNETGKQQVNERRKHPGTIDANKEVPRNTDGTDKQNN